MRDIGPEIAILVLVVVVIGLVLPAGYFMLRRPSRSNRSLLLVSTNEKTIALVSYAAKQVGYATLHVYRHEDALEKLLHEATLRMIIIDDSVPQYEAGLLLSTLQRLPADMRPLILIQDNSELGQTTRSHRVEAIISHPLTGKALETAIRRVDKQVELERKRIV